MFLTFKIRSSARLRLILVSVFFYVSFKAKEWHNILKKIKI